MNNGLWIVLGVLALIHFGGGDSVDDDEQRAVRSASRKGQKAFRVEYASADADEIDDEIIVAHNRSAAIAEMRHRMKKSGAPMKGATFEAEEIEAED